MDLVEIFPAFGVRIECGPLTLRSLREADAPRVAELAAAGIHAPDARPFIMGWNREENQPLLSLQFFYKNWASFSPEAWTLMLAVERDGVMVGVQDVNAHDFEVLRVGETGSWLGLAFQGQGTGTLMRQAVLAFMFDDLGAVEMRSAAWEDNPNSHRVSEKAGYALNGYRLGLREGERHREDEFVVTPETLVRPPYDVVVEGLAPFRRAIGLEAGE
jgi:RimJ/RimL family protein N-acetyltransferase